MNSSSLAIWLDAARPKTLPLAIASIVCGSAVAGWQGSFSALIAGLALLTALLLQILSNLANDYGDAVKGTDNKHRLGPQRAIQSGMVTPSAMRNAMILNTVLTITSGLSLIFIACNNLQDMFGFMLLGLMAIAASIAYTVGNKPYGYRGLGDLSVLMFFGWLGVAGTYYLQAGQIDSIIMLPATACGLLSVGVLNINNLRDIDNDRACGKLTPGRAHGTRLGTQIPPVPAGRQCRLPGIVCGPGAAFSLWLAVCSQCTAIVQARQTGSPISRRGRSSSDDGDDGEMCPAHKSVVCRRRSACCYLDRPH